MSSKVLRYFQMVWPSQNIWTLIKNEWKKKPFRLFTRSRTSPNRRSPFGRRSRRCPSATSGWAASGCGPDLQSIHFFGKPRNSGLVTMPATIPGRLARNCKGNKHTFLRLYCIFYYNLLYVCTIKAVLLVNDKENK
jgi:hypothetical protein